MLSDYEAGRLRAFLLKNQKVSAVLEMAPSLGMKNWYLGAGCIAQTVWNELHGFPSETNIKDYDLVYFDSSDVSYAGEDSFIKRGASLFRNLRAPVEIRNEARVHLWYKERFGNAIEPYQSSEDAISTWPTTATSVGVTVRDRGKFEVFAPFGLSDLFAIIARPNKKQATEEIYVEKVRRWAPLWPKLRVIPWEGAP